MRLSESQIKVIREQAFELFGGSVKIWLFGSRVDDRQKGGDIDLFLETDQVLENRASAAARFAARLQRKLGDRRIDILLVDPNTPTQPIHDIARAQGILL